VTGAPEFAEAVSIVGQFTVAEFAGLKMVTPGAADFASTTLTATADSPALSATVPVRV
jgi:hypothetical protein